MNKATLVQQAKPASFLPSTQSILQRKCECGTHTPAGGECAACGKQKSVVQRKTGGGVTAIGNSPPRVMQAKLSIGASDDPLEREADRVADQVMEAPARLARRGAPMRIQRFTGQATGQTDTAPASVDRVLASLGRPLEPALRQDMGQRFGYDFSRVRVHSGAAAEQSAREVNANAYTVGHDVVFGASQFAPETHEGRRLIAHELTHVVQQSGSDGIRADLGNEKRSLAPIAQQNLGGALNLSKFSDSSLGQAASDLNQASSPINVSRSTAPGLACQKAMEATKPQPVINHTIKKQSGRSVIAVNDVAIAESDVPPGEIDFSYKWTPDNLQIMIVIPEGGEAFLIQSLNTNTALLKLSSHVTLSIKEKLKVPRRTFNELAGGFNPLEEFATVETITAQRPRPVPAKKAPVPPQPPPQVVPPQTSSQPGTSAITTPIPSAQIFPPPPISLDLPPASKYGKPKTEKEIVEERTYQKEQPTAVGQIKELTELIKKTSDAATKDTLVRKLRDLLSGLQPFIPAKDAKQMIDDGIRSLVKDGADGAIMAILKAITGKSPSTMPENRNQTGPDVQQKDLGEHILQAKIPIKDAPAPAPRFSFQYRNGPQKSYEVGGTIRFTLIPPDNFSSLQGAKRLVIVAEADRNTPNPERFARIDLESASPKPVELQAPQKPGKYVIRVDIGHGFDYSSMQEFVVSTPQKK